MVWPRNLLLSCAVILCFALITPAIGRAQMTTVDDTTSTPTPGVGHNYIHMLNETVNPANGSVSLRIELPTPKDRGDFHLPFYIAYDSGSVNHLLPGFYPRYGTVNWAPNTGTFIKEVGAIRFQLQVPFRQITQKETTRITTHVS